MLTQSTHTCDTILNHNFLAQPPQSEGSLSLSAPPTTPPPLHSLKHKPNGKPCQIQIKQCQHKTQEQDQSTRH